MTALLPGPMTICIDDKIAELRKKARKLRGYAPTWEHKEYQQNEAAALQRLAEMLESRWNAGARYLNTGEFGRLLAPVRELQKVENETVRLRYEIAAQQSELQRLQGLSLAK